MNYWLLERARRSGSDLTAGTRAKIELTLWREALRTELRRTQWTLDGLGYLVALWGISDMDGSMGTVLASLSADGSPALAVSYSLDHGEITRKLAELGPVQDYALREALTRWRIEDRSHDEAGWHLVGVRVVASGTALSGSDG